MKKHLKTDRPLRWNGDEKERRMKKNMHKEECTKVIAWIHLARTGSVIYTTTLPLPLGVR